MSEPLVLIVSFDAGTVNEIPVDDSTVLSLSNRSGHLTTISLKGVRTLVLTEAMDDLDNTFGVQ